MDPLDVRIVRGATTSPRVLELRSARIREAVSWEPGPSLEQQRRYPVYRISAEIEGGFRKPGKERFRKTKNPNVHDMKPFVGEAYDGATFHDAWAYLSRIALIDFDDFRAVLTLLYRMILFVDHAEDGPQVRYRPQPSVQSRIDEIDRRARGELPAGGLMGLLYFLDLLAWNEDVKYHAERPSGVPRFDSDWIYTRETGPETCLGTAIHVTYDISRLVLDADQLSKVGKKPDFNVPYRLLQRMATSRGVCPPSQGQLVSWLSPLVTLDKNGTSLKSEPLF